MVLRTRLLEARGGDDLQVLAMRQASFIELACRRLHHQSEVIERPFAPPAMAILLFQSGPNRGKTARAIFFRRRQR